MGNINNMNWNILIKCFLCILIFHSTFAKEKHHRGKSAKISGIDLLNGLSFTNNIHQSTHLNSHRWTSSSPSTTDNNSGDITHIDLHKIIHKNTREITVEFIGYSHKKTFTKLFGIYLKHRPLPLFEISLDGLRQKIFLRYQGERSFQRVAIGFGKALAQWTVLSASVNSTHFSVTTGCDTTKSVKLRQKLDKLPRRAFGVLGSDKTGEDRFVGQLFEARVYTGNVHKKVLLCSQPVNLNSFFAASEGYVNDGPGNINGDRILLLEQQITQLNKIVDRLKKQGDNSLCTSQNANLTDRVTDLEECVDCGSTECMWEGKLFDEGETWTPDECTVCICKENRSDCLIRTDVPSCQIPCSTNPCMNHGQCYSFENNVPDMCQCQSPYGGPYCEYKENPCVWPRESGICDQNIPRFYYDADLQECLSFNYSGCGGNINNYESLEDCQAVTIKGACCYRQYSVKAQDVLISSQNETFGCKEMSLAECQATHRTIIDDTKLEVISFYPGVSCDEAKCGLTAMSCMIDDREYNIGDKAVLGCQECTCMSSGQFVCSCSKKAERKEIRDMTSAELAQFQAAIQQLRLVGPGNPWEELRDVYMRHSMHANGGPYFLPWHRVFLRRLEQRLQEIDCSITLPYFEFITDIGKFEDAIIWQPNYFGGNGTNDFCVIDHPFGLPGSWRPCITRKFDRDVNLPTMLELSLALASDDYVEMSRCLEAFASYIHTYIGGEMATSAAPYDPVFYSIHAYIDMLYWLWQKKGDNKFNYPAEFSNIPMIPFNMPPHAIFDLEADLCVTYILPSRGSPCNVTEDPEKIPERGDVSPEGDEIFIGEFNTLGYNTDGYDRRGFDQFGYNDRGFNRDGYNRLGFDYDGYNRYGYDVNGYSRYGYDIEGFDRDNQPDETGRYNAFGLDINCLDRRGLTIEGYDRYGFNLYGYNKFRCNYFNRGPYSTIQSQRIWDILLKQSKPFLMSLQRTCLGLKPLSHNWLQQYWITDIKDVSNLINVTSVSETNEKNSARFCFDIDDFVTPCECDVGIATCTDNPCQTMTCPSYPEASCRIDFCGTCKATFHLNGVEVDCSEERDFCQPNPCENGGTCVPSIWPSEPQLTTCQCPPGFDGHYCQYKALEVCELPVSRGDCSKQESRWYFDPITQSCKFFLYTGCAGNANNFVSKDLCESRCRVGACCYRFPKRRGATIGYDLQGFDRYGFNVAGQNRRGDIRTEQNGIKTGMERFSTTRYDEMGFDRNGYDSQGYDRFGLDKSGYDREGFNLLGYNRQGEYDGIIDYNEQGYDEEGYNRAGYNCQGTNREGLNIYEMYREYVYRCRSATLAQCQRLEQEQGHQVVKFTPGKSCDQVNCTQTCGCSYNGQSYMFGQTFKSGCQFCTCTYTGFVECVCPEIYRRKEVRDMTQDEMRKYQDAVKQLAKTAYPSRWFKIAETFAQHKPQAVGNSASLPWHRYFLSTIEKQLQEYDCSITIPYYDWTLHAGNQQRSTIWAANMFGGDGSGFNGCVEHHPFKDYYPPYWVPCLQRQFNNSIQLPDVVDIQYALNEETYERFRISMEVYFDIFKSWVGGSMASDYAPYDPLYLSVAAFIDRIWWDWQKKHDSALLNYPQDMRYIPMMPFKATPDDIMDSKKQMCVTYFPLSEGAVCNITQTNLNYNSLGYDRHGFNREGYDIEGYNVFGLDRNGNMDNRGIYNELGFDREGFKRNGYDKSGFDRYGFYVDGYNVDGYDSTGYDRTGYDRYGFDRTGVTPFGFHRNGTLVNGNVPTTFDPYGYNTYGLNRYGFDRQGYDIFGFDSFGYDQRRCNRYYLGPMLVLIKRWAELELDKTDKPTVRIITRICPPVSALPEWRYTRNWLKRDGQLPLIEGILGRAQQRVQGLLPDVRSSSVVDNNLWLPLGPDRNLCFVSYYYTECPFGEFPVSCVEDLCASRRCPGYPDAVCRVSRCGSCEHEWYNGITGDIIQCSGCVDRNGIDRAEGSSWSISECESCTCQDGLVSCVETQCDPVLCTHPVKLRGQCCLTCDAGCDYEGRVYREGQIFPLLTDPCQECSCEGGNVECYKSPCPDLDLTCQSPTLLEGECCPVCLDCGIHGNGETWNETPCQECTCLDGRVDCERIRCIPPDCSHPWTPPGQCCSECDGCSVDGRDLQSGETYKPEQCTECLCEEGNLKCDFLPCPIAPCLNPITPPGECCPRCDNECEYNFRRYRHMESFLSEEDKCTNCTCDNGFVNCVPVTCPRMNLPCRRPVTLPGDCCPSACPKCMVDGVEYETGSTWKSASDPCETCRCDEGVVVCTRQERCPVECEHGVVRPGECCSECRDCVFDGQYVRDGQVFVRPGDNCQQCTCTRGQVTCESLGPCPRLPCRVTETPPGACCPQCKRCEYEGNMYTHGEQVYTDRCSVCTCLEGEVTCEREDCPDVTCRNPVTLPDQCCPVCLECQYKGATYQEGQRFTPPTEPCHDCECRGGEVTCLSREADCPISRCTHPIRSFRQCCPTCDGCSFMRRRFRNGQKFVPPGSDNCKVCRCVDGSVDCSTMGCPAVNCDNAVLVKGQCCPVCPMGCNVMGIEYRDGQTFIDFMNRCQVCTCMMGQIRCMQMMTCPEVTCTHPANMPGNCCPSCSKCEQNSMQYSNGESFTNPADPCQECVCRNVFRSLYPVGYLKVSLCGNGNCCPLCSMCEQKSMQYIVMGSFTNPADPCQECVCRDGSITCRSKAISCPRVRCENPVLNPDTCCPVCEDSSCVYAGRQYRDGQEVPASRDVCEMCECSGGMIDCNRKVCPSVNCRNPGRTDCCDTCEFCEFNGMNLELGKVFPSPTDPCEECVCMAGTVECQRIYCDIPNCSNPSLIPGACCPQCTDCTYQGLLFRDGEDFQNPSNPCEVCHCMKGSVACDRTLCPKVSCDNPVQDGCCPRCSGCSYGNTNYKNGEDFRSADGCGICRCVDGQVQCGSPNCPNVSCSHPVRNQCCEECTDCSFQGTTIQNGRSIPDPSDGCRRCVCRYGTVTCEALPCQPVTCLNPSRGRCCPECRDCNYLGDIVTHGQTVPSKYNECEDCQCVLGNIQCFNKTCPPAQCMYPIQTDCCRSCTGCRYNGRDYANGDEVLMSEDSCETCVCQQGNLQCSRRQCPPVNCESPVMGQCCPECRDTTCIYNNRQYGHRELFQDPTDECSECQCFQGGVSCRKRPCQPVNCESPVMGQCCPECHDDVCTYDNKQYRDRELFQNPSDECSDCQCYQGNVRCRKRQCDPVNCESPVMGKCCPECRDDICEYNNEQYQDGQRFRNPLDECSDCQCYRGNVRCRKRQCPPVNCESPTMGQCCPECNDGSCIHNGSKYRNEQVFQDPSDECSVCQCLQGDTICERRECPPVSCTNPIIVGCCPVCKNCFYEGEEIQHGDFVPNRNNSCDRCRCESGNIKCYGVGCPRVTCSHPTKSGCCETCDSCLFNGLEVQNNERFINPTDPCERCICTDGNVVCREEPCPGINCDNPVQGECCLTCPTVQQNCVYKDKEIQDGARFIDDSNVCIVCTCREGVLACSNRCPARQCSHPSQGQCEDCEFNGKIYKNRQPFRDECNDCVCINGNVDCTSLGCRPVTCLNPTIVDCCPVCLPPSPRSGSCNHGNRLLRDGETVPNTEDPCSTCTCRAGRMDCIKDKCPCSHPSQGQCEDCEFNGRTYSNRETFRDECNDCVCINGNVDCTSLGCRPVTCLNPTIVDCCPVCLPPSPRSGSCNHGNRLLRDGETVPDARDPCSICTCRDGRMDCRKDKCQCSHPSQGQCEDCEFNGKIYENRQPFRHECNDCVCINGNVDCTSLGCRPVTCLNPTIVDCCPVCLPPSPRSGSCNHGNRLLRDGETLPDARDPCSTCTCRAGRIDCRKEQCPAISCKHPAMGKCCPECNNCQVGARKIANGDVYPDPNNKCFLCMCKNGNINCERRPCSFIKCLHPSKDECGCPACGFGCEYQGLTVKNGESFEDPSDRCTKCICRGGYVQCDKNECQQTCTHPADSDGCCPLCKSCLYEGQIQIDGARFTSVTDPCQECDCQAGSVNCTQQICPRLLCDNPVAEPGQCCAVCPGVTECFYEGRTYRDGETFPSPYDKCSTCTCSDGRVRCERQRCTDRCSHPRPGTCCPTCDLCFYDGKLYNNNSTFTPDPCSQCRCLDGSVTCTEKTCPNLSCREQETRQGECCPVCKGCTSDGILYSNGAEWTRRDDPCETCTCVQGLVTCSTVKCVTPCFNPVSIPGQCCPVCPGCRFGEREYEVGESFSPSGDPCDVCTCNEDRLQCYHNACPHLRDCPMDQQRDPEPGTCCPVCTALSSCTRDRFGEIRVQKDDPCQYCVCNNFQWECKEESCPDLSCPRNVWIYRVCCPTCPACYDVSTGIYYRDGQEWKHRDNNCLHCVCQNGYVDCEPIYCGPAVCLNGEQLITSPDECCPRCEPVNRLDCEYQGSVKKEFEEWQPDECTTCQCFAGSVSCNSQACDIPVCSQDDSLTVLPGNCCPVCIPKPGTCLVYGDPHYRTFDGSTLHFQGTCKYVMARDCDDQDFRLEVHHDDRGVNGVSWAQNFTLLTSGVKVDVLQNNVILINNRQVSLPYTDGRNISIEKRDDNVLINTKFGVKLVWDGKSYAELTVPGNYKRRMCGLCGNFNGYPQDDMRIRSGQIANSAAVFGNSWKVSDESAGQCDDATDADPCNSVSYRQRKEATSMCEVLSGQQFSPCHRAVPVAPYYASCIYDLCACTNSSACLCDILASYAKECAKSGVRLEWRSQTLCAITCDTDNGFIFDECGPVCQRTCNNWRTPLGDLRENCYKPCVAGCQCTADKVVHNGRCILPQECPS